MIIDDLISHALIYLCDKSCLRTAGVESLYQISSEQDDGSQLFRGLNALRKCQDIVVVAESDYFLNKMLLLRLRFDLAQKLAVYLDIVGHISQQVADV